MRVAVTTWGARGDYQPYLALANAFVRAGHEVQLGAPRLPGFAEAAAKMHIPFVALGDIAETQPLDEVLGKLLGVLLDEPALVRMYWQCRELSRWADVVVCHFFQPAGRMAAEALGRPFATAAMVPWQLPSAYYPPTLKLPRWGKRFNRLSWRIIGAMFNARCGSINRVRRQLGLPALRDLTADGFYAPDLNLVAASPQVTPPPPDWPHRHRMTGYWFLDEPEEWRPPPEVEDFVERGPRPIAIGFGSMRTPDPVRVTRVLLDAVKLSGVRAVIEPGWAGLGAGALPPTVLRASVPHSWLFPRVTAVVHHGGAGTTAAALRAGVPSVFVPHIFDQEFWAETGARHGVSPPAIPWKDMTAERLSQAISLAVSNQQFSARAARLGATLRGEDGVGAAVGMVEALVRGGRPRTPEPAGT